MNPQTNSSTLKLQTNVPETIALEFALGRPVQSQYGGDQTMFSLVDGRRLYVSPYVAQKIYDAGVEAGTPFEICKREVAHGNRRTVEYQIRTANDASAGTSVNVPVATTTTTTASAKTLQFPNSNPAAAPVAAKNGAAKRLAECMAAALNIVSATARLDTAFEYNGEDVRNLGVTLFIQISRGGEEL